MKSNLRGSVCLVESKSGSIGTDLVNKHQNDCWSISTATAKTTHVNCGGIVLGNKVVSSRVNV